MALSHDATGYGRTLTVLVVEDDPAVADLLRALLNRMPGWGATVVQHAAAAIEVVKNVRVEALVLDVNLPGISGIELLALLRTSPHWRQPPVILLSADAEQRAVQEALDQGLVFRFLAKPFDVDALLDAVAEAATSFATAGPRNGVSDQEAAARRSA